MDKIKITIKNCRNYVYRICDIDDIEKMLKFLYLRDNLKYDEIQYKKSRFVEELRKNKEIFLVFDEIKPTWLDESRITLSERINVREDSVEFIEFKETTLNDMSLIYVRNVFKYIGVGLIIFLFFFVISHSTPDDIAALVIGTIFFGALAAISEQIK